MEKRCRLAGAKFVLKNSEHQPMLCVMTNENGEALIDCLPYGTYYLCETEAPCDYTPCCKEVEIVIDDKNDCRTVEFVNIRKSGSIKIIKYGENGCIK